MALPRGRLPGALLLINLLLSRDESIANKLSQLPTAPEGRAESGTSIVIYALPHAE